MKKSFFLIPIFCIIFFITVVSDTNAQTIYTKSEGPSTLVDGYAHDSGSFALADGFYFIEIKVSAFVEDGDENGNLMSAIASISVNGRGGSVYVCAADFVEDSPNDVIMDVSGRDADGSSWYWTVDTRNNPGVGIAGCYWEWMED